MGWLGRGIGQFGSDVGEGYNINLGWKERAQQMALANARQKLADLMGPLQVQEIQARLKQMQQQQAQSSPEYQISQAEKLLGRQLTPEERVQLAGFKPPTKTKEQQGYTDTKVDTKGNLWGFNKATGKYEQIPTGAKFHEPGAASGPGDVDAYAYDVAAGKATMPSGKFGAQVAKRMKELGLEPPLKKPPKAVPPDVLAMLNGPIPQTPTAEQSRRLADAADRIFGGSAYKQDLISRGRRSSFMGLRSPYEAASYDAKEYTDIVGLLKQSTQDLSDLGGKPAE